MFFHTWGVKEAFREENAGALWGAYEYTPDRDVLRTTMRVTTHPVSAEQLIITFTDMTLEGGQLTIWWDDQVASTSFFQGEVSGFSIRRVASRVPVVKFALTTREMADGEIRRRLL